MFAEFNGSRNLGEKITGRIKIYSTRDFLHLLIILYVVKSYLTWIIICFQQGQDFLLKTYFTI